MLRPGPSAPAGVYRRFSIVVHDPIRLDDGSFQRDGIVWDGVSAEGFSGSATVSNHAVPITGSFADHAQVQPRQFNAQVYAATPLETDEPVDHPGNISIDYIKSPTWASDFAGGVQAIDDKLFALLGVPMILNTARHGALISFALTSFNSSRDRKGVLRWDLSFQEIRKAYVPRVGIPAAPRAEKQAEPEPQDCTNEELGESLPEPTKVTIAAAALGLDEAPVHTYVQGVPTGAGPARVTSEWYAEIPVTLE